MLFRFVLVFPTVVISQSPLPGVPGTPGDDYPVLSAPLPTSFDCNDGFIPGYYAHTEVNINSVLSLIWPIHPSLGASSSASAPQPPLLAGCHSMTCSVLMELSSIRSCLSVIGGSMLTAGPLLTSTTWMKKYKMPWKLQTQPQLLQEWTVPFACQEHK